ncbi:MAG: 50S ribosomal protein L9 [Gammaproteobacteria bacterium]|nr:50S ribosomal protein L9 [Gammaproteobacteria bacterium]
MEVVLLEKIENLGNLGDKVTVKAGFARNFLMPQGKAKPATAENVAEFEARRAELEKAAANALAAAQTRANAIGSLGAITIQSKVSSEGKLFGSVNNIEIVEALSASGVDIQKSEIRMPEGPIREVGEYVVGVHVHSDIDVSVTVVVTDEE